MKLSKYFFSKQIYEMCVQWSKSKGQIFDGNGYNADQKQRILQYNLFASNFGKKKKNANVIW